MGDSLGAFFMILLIYGVPFAISIWLMALFVRLCRNVKAIKAILMTAYDLEEFWGQDGFVYRKHPPTSDKEATPQV